MQNSYGAATFKSIYMSTRAPLQILSSGVLLDATFIMDKIYIFCDESCQESHKFMLIGGIAIKSDLVQSFDQAIEQMRQETNMHKELKWTKVTQQKLAEYKRFIDLLFDWIDARKVSFHCMILDNTKIDQRRFGGSYELGFHKFVYQLLLHGFAKRYGKSNNLYVHLDQRQKGYDLNDLRRILNNGVKKRLRNDRRPFRLVEPANSKNVAAVQMADLVLGALAYRKNDRHLLAGTKQAKIDLSAHVIKRASVKADLRDTPTTQARFTIWNFLLQ